MPVSFPFTKHYTISHVSFGAIRQHYRIAHFKIAEINKILLNKNLIKEKLNASDSYFSISNDTI